MYVLKTWLLKWNWAFGKTRYDKMPWHALPTLPLKSVYIEFNFFFLHIIFIIIFLYKIWILRRACSNSAHSSLIADCKELMSKFPGVQIKHYYREANQCANRLAKSIAKLGQDFVVNGSPPTEINLLLFYDLFGMYFEWLMPYSVP